MQGFRGSAEDSVETREGQEATDTPHHGSGGASDKTFRAWSHLGSRKGESAFLLPSLINEFTTQQTLWSTYSVSSAV